MPQGPAKAVLVAAVAISQIPLAFGASSGPTCSGCPERKRSMSGSGPFGPILNGVWQSEQPIMFTRYLPRSARPAPASWVAADAVTDTPLFEQPAVMVAARMMTAAAMVVFIRSLLV